LPQKQPYCYTQLLILLSALQMIQERLAPLARYHCNMAAATFLWSFITREERNIRYSVSRKKKLF
jgi:hypothetical protein